MSTGRISRKQLMDALEGIPDDISAIILERLRLPESPRERKSLRERIRLQLGPCRDPACGCECLLWAGKRDRDGYGHLSVKGRGRLIHRVAWELENGPIPDGLQIDHVKERGCVHVNCANVAHLEPVTPRENSLRSRSFAAVNARKTHCPKGHEYSPANTHIRKSGRRRCRACTRESRRKTIKAAA